MSCKWVMVRKKRSWVPEKLWAALCLVGLADTWPLLQILTEKVNRADSQFDWNLGRWRTDFWTEYVAWRDADFPEPPPEITNEISAMMRVNGIGGHGHD